MALRPGNLFTENQASVETTIDDWASFLVSSSSTVQSTTQALSGTHSIRATYNGTASDVMASITTTASVPQVAAAIRYDYWFWVFSPRAVSYGTVVDWYRASNVTFISTTTGTLTSVPANVWTRVGYQDYALGTHTSPALATQARTYIKCSTGLTTSDLVYFDDAFLGQRLFTDPVMAPRSMATMMRAHNW
jgi:hypothetical protein